MNKSVPRVTVWYHSAEPCDAKTVTLWTDLSIRTSHSRGRTGLVVKASDSGSGDPGSILSRVGVLFP